MKHFASPRFWACHQALPESVRKVADKNFELLKANPHYPSLQFKKIGKDRSVRVGLHYRALAVEVAEGGVDPLSWTPDPLGRKEYTKAVNSTVGVRFCLEFV